MNRLPMGTAEHLVLTDTRYRAIHTDEWPGFLFSNAEVVQI